MMPNASIQLIIIDIATWNFENKGACYIECVITREGLSL
jgi:hypothetical protein